MKKGIEAHGAEIAARFAIYQYPIALGGTTVGNKNHVDV
jgi:hypothetical protein